ncbi:MAG: hypothetical protein WBI17_14915 [Clostridiaceae bacterium]
MKKIKISIVLVISTMIMFACITQSKEDATAKEFISAYYSQYAKKDEIKAIFETLLVPEITETAITTDFNKLLADFFYANFDGMLTEKAISNLLNKRIIPTLAVLDTDIIKATVKNVKFVEAKNQIKGTLSFTAKIIFEHSDGAKTEETTTGLIRVIEESGFWLIDSFKLN